MKKRVLMIAALVSGTLAISGCTTNPYTGRQIRYWRRYWLLSGRWRRRALLFQT